MADPEHVEIVKKGAKAIAKWRKANPTTQLNLSEANLFSADLSRADLSRANLRGANLIEANLREAKLSGAELSWVRLSDADLRAADLNTAHLNRADLSRVGLSGVDLGTADLFRANFANSDIGNANFQNALLGYTILAGIDLSTARGLETVRHVAPSSIGVDTLFKSSGNIPEAFLRGCGVPEILIESLSKLVGAMEPSQYYSCFIS